MPRIQGKASGYEDRSSDVVGYWDPDYGDLHFTPVSAKMFDGQLNPEKASILVTGKLDSPCVISKGDEQDPNKKKLGKGAIGENVGVWLKPGMRDLIHQCGIATRVAFAGTKDVHKGKRGMNPMKVFTVSSDKPGTRIPVIEDRRDKSKGAPTLFDGAGDDDDV